MTCRCGCGTPVSGKWNSHTGRPIEYVSGHNWRGKTRPPETRRRQAVSKFGNTHSPKGPRPELWTSKSARKAHAFLNLHYPRSGVCAKCGAEGKTDYAFLRHPEPHTRNRDDYRELCRSCHMHMDVDSGHRRYKRKGDAGTELWYAEQRRKEDAA